MVLISLFLYWKNFQLFYNTSYLNKEVKCTEPSPTVSIPWLEHALLHFLLLWRVLHFSIIMLSVITLSVVMLCVVAFSKFQQTLFWIQSPERNQYFRLKFQEKRQKGAGYTLCRNEMKLEKNIFISFLYFCKRIFFFKNCISRIFFIFELLTTQSSFFLQFFFI
jgi:hypothetical protein